MLSHPLAALDLFCVFVCCWHKKIVELCLCPLRCSTTCQQLSKAHDILVSVYRFTVADLDLWNFRGQVRAKTLYSMLFIFYFLFRYVVFLVVISFAKIQIISDWQKYIIHSFMINDSFATCLNHYLIKIGYWSPFRGCSFFSL